MPQKYLVAGEWRESDDVLDVTFPYDGSVVDSVFMAGEKDMHDAMDAALRGFEITRKLPSYQRSDILFKLRDLMQSQFDELVDLMILEGGKSRKVATGELKRAIQTTHVSAEEARRMEGDVFSIDWTPAGEGRQGFTRRAPIGTILGITPFNYPVNLAMHKIGPAIATGNAIILKPAEKTPLSSVVLAEMILEAGFPPEAFSMLNAGGKESSVMVNDDRIAMISFTGSAQVGWMLKGQAKYKKVALELGGNAGVIVHEDADLDMAIQQTVSGGFTNAGQNCISVQRILVHEAVFDAFKDRYVAGVEALNAGDPRDADTDVGPLITLDDAERAANWVQSAVEQGATVLTGGNREGTMLQPTVLADTTGDMKVNCEEIFAPVVTLRPYRTWKEAIQIMNDSPYGLQAGIFTSDMKRIMQAWDEIEVGGLHVNSASTFRVDHMPYGGVKKSGFGREGVKYAMEDMTELRLMVLNLN